MLNTEVTIPLNRLEWLSEKLEALDAELIKFNLIDTTSVSRNGQVLQMAIISVWGGQPGDVQWRAYGEVRWDEETGENIVESWPGLELEAIPERFRHTGRVCDYCNLVRRRNTTYIILHVDTGEWMQIGSTCIQKLTKGITAADIAKQAAILREAADYVQEAADTSFEPAGFDPERYLAAAFEARSLHPEADNAQLHPVAVSLLSETHPQHAAQVEGVLAQLEQWRQAETKSNFAHNACVAFENGVLKPEHAHIALALTRSRTELTSYTQYVAQPGAQLGVEGLECLEAFYVESRGFWVNKFDLDGKLLVWMTGSGYTVGQQYRGQIRVRSHQSYEGNATTYIHYCRLEEMDG